MDGDAAGGVEPRRYQRHTMLLCRLLTLRSAPHGSWQATTTMYVPEFVKNARVVVATKDEGLYLIDNSELQCASRAVAYRKSMDMDDRATHGPDYGSVVHGVLRNGWLEVQVRVEALRAVPWESAPDTTERRPKDALRDIELVEARNCALQAVTGGPPAVAASIVGAMRLKQGWEHLQRTSLRALMAIASAGFDGCEGVCLAGGVEAALEAMRRHTKAAELQVVAARLLAKVAQGGADFRAQVVRAGGLEAIAGALRKHAPGSVPSAVAAAEQAVAKAEGSTIGLPERFLHVMQPGQFAPAYPWRAPAYAA